jgi:RimJ/RimL family protein N-acetyltransferase
MMRFEGKQLTVRTIEADDLEKLLPVFLSNPVALQQTEGSDGEIGKYDLERWQRDWSIAQMMPERHMLGCYLKEQDAAIGFVEYIDEHDRLGQPWLGAVVIHKLYQRQGLGTQAVQLVVEHIHKETGASILYGGVTELNVQGLTFAQHIGFRPSSQEVSHRFPTGKQSVVVLELPLMSKGK